MLEDGESPGDDGSTADTALVVSISSSAPMALDDRSVALNAIVHTLELHQHGTGHGTLLPQQLCSERRGTALGRAPLGVLALIAPQALMCGETFPASIPGTVIIMSHTPKFREGGGSQVLLNSLSRAAQWPAVNNVPPPAR